MARLHDVVFDCHRPSALARFWAGALDGYDIAPYDDDEIERLRSIGIDDIEDDPNVLVEAPGAEPRFFFQLVPESKTVKNRVHLDLLCDDVETETARLVALGARVLTTTGPSAGWVVLADPEGNEFCLST
jgi:hypothetical protein